MVLKYKNKPSLIFYKGIVLALILVLQLSCACTKNNSARVYITKTGSHYHTRECVHLGKSKIPIKLETALNDGYTACKRCKATSLTIPKE